MAKVSTNGPTNAVVRAMTWLLPYRWIGLDLLRVRIFSMEENFRTLYGVHVRHHHLNLTAQSVGCVYKVNFQVKIRVGRSLSDVLGLNWIESTEWDHVWMFGGENPEESWRLTWDLANSINLPETPKRTKPTGAWESITITLVGSCWCLYTVYKFLVKQVFCTW